MQQLPDINDVYRARERITAHIHRTPVLKSRTLNQLLNAELFFKCENFQRAGAFKFRGALNTVLALDNSLAVRGVTTHSSGNHGSALALAASVRGVPAYVVMPTTAVDVKRRAAVAYGAQIIDCEPTLSAREAGAEETLRATGAAFIHPYNDVRVIAGQGTIGLELCEQIRQLDTVIVPVGGGGLISGVALALKTLAPNVRVVGAEPTTADDARQSLASGVLIQAQEPMTVADGLKTSLGEVTFQMIQRYVDDIITASEDAIIRMMRMIWERMKISIEPSAAVPLAALLENRDSVPGTKIGIVLSGGNSDLSNLPWQ